MVSGQLHDSAILHLGNKATKRLGVPLSQPGSFAEKTLAPARNQHTNHPVDRPRHTTNLAVPAPLKKQVTMKRFMNHITNGRSSQT